MKLHEVETIDAMEGEVAVDSLRVRRIAVPGGWLYVTDFRTADSVHSAFVPDARAEHVTSYSPRDAEKIAEQIEAVMRSKGRIDDDPL